MKFRDVPVPLQMQNLPTDKRGYPIPVMVLRDLDGTPHFTVNDENKRLQLIAQDKCAICGTGLLRGRWFVGGPMSAFHEHGTYLDPPLHHECATYALQVCPWLAVSKYNSRIESGTLARMDSLREVVLVDNTVIPDKPELFVSVMARGQKYHRGASQQVYVRPTRPYIRVEYWRGGGQIPEHEGRMICQEVLGSPLPKLQAPVAGLGFEGLDAARRGR